MSWEQRMAERARERNEPTHVAEWDLIEWRDQNIVLDANGALLYPHGMPCSLCGVELDPDFRPKDHTYIPGPEDEVCRCGWHESYHRPHDCAKDTYEPHLCACAGGQPWVCCSNYHARQTRFLHQRLANVLRAAVEAP